MPFEKGNNLGKGRPKGKSNKVTEETREKYKAFVEGNIDNLQTWMDKVAHRDPAAALDFMLKFSEYFIPKLQRTELTGEDGEEIKQTITFLIKK